MHIMKYIPYHILTCLLCLGLLPAHADEGKLTDTYTTERPVVIACDWDKAPYEFLNDNGQPAGSNIDVIRIILKYSEEAEPTLPFCHERMG